VVTMRTRLRRRLPLYTSHGSAESASQPCPVEPRAKKIRPWNFSRGPILSAPEGRSCIYVPIIQNGRWSTAKDMCLIQRMNNDQRCLLSGVIQTFSVTSLTSLLTH
jgi:hypothetical protein